MHCGGGCLVTHAYMWLDSFMRETWLMPICDMTCAKESSVPKEQLAYECAMSNIWRGHVIHMKASSYGVPTISRHHKNIGLFCKTSLQKRLYSAKETYDVKEPTNRSYPVHKCMSKWLVQKSPTKIQLLHTHSAFSNIAAAVYVWHTLCERMICVSHGRRVMSNATQV